MELRFTSPEQRATFAGELQQAVLNVAGLHSAPYMNADGSRSEGPPFQLVLGCYPRLPEVEPG